MVGSTRDFLTALSRASVPSSSAPIRQVYQATSPSPATLPVALHVLADQRRLVVSALRIKAYRAAAVELGPTSGLGQKTEVSAAAIHFHFVVKPDSRRTFLFFISRSNSDNVQLTKPGISLRSRGQSSVLFEKCHPFPGPRVGLFVGAHIGIARHVDLNAIARSNSDGSADHRRLEGGFFRAADAANSFAVKAAD